MKRSIGLICVCFGVLGVAGVISCGPSNEPAVSECVGSNCPEEEASDNPDAGGQSCAGCTVDGTCVEGTAQEACGSGGEVCTSCGATETCSQDGLCVEKDCHSGNCDGCCKNGTCVEGKTSMACGSGGTQCTSCGDKSQCVDRSCETCADGCWTDQNACVDGTSKETCGAGGAVCVSCGANETCKSGECVEQTSEDCANNCDGCCSGSTCIAPGDISDAQCGSGGESCVSCSSGLTCTASGSCGIASGSKWDVVVVGASLDKETIEGDQATGPDPFAKVTIGETTKKTKIIHDNYEPHWNETLIEGVSASQISGMVYDLIDDDSTPLIGNDGIVTDCEPNFTEDDVAFGSATHTCTGGKDADNEATTEFRFEAASQ